MTFPLSVVVAIFILVFGFAVFAQLRRERVLANEWQPVDLRAMARLLDRADDEFLAAHVRSFVMLRLRIKRALAAAHYLVPLKANCGRAIAIARLKPQEEELFRSATLLRMEITRLHWKVWLGVVWPLNANVERLDALFRLLQKQEYVEH